MSSLWWWFAFTLNIELNRGICSVNMLLYQRWVKYDTTTIGILWIDFFGTMLVLVLSWISISLDCTCWIYCVDTWNSLIFTSPIFLILVMVLFAIPLDYLFCLNHCKLLCKCWRVVTGKVHCIFNWFFLYPWIRQFHAVIPPKFQYINCTISTHYDFAYDINPMVIAYKPVRAHRFN